MSLTSYRAAPPRVNLVNLCEKKNVIYKPGNDLLFHTLRCSTIGAEKFNGRVRDGIGFRPLARITKLINYIKSRISYQMNIKDKNDQANRVISTSQLHVLPHFHTWPINVVVFHDSHGRTSFEGGFPLRCFQRLSRPYIATLLCRWRDNRSTRGTSTPVLSY